MTLTKLNWISRFLIRNEGMLMDDEMTEIVGRLEEILECLNH